tara:strand:+ start:207 stop:425 length:219 start_codon:yes stop_codon:yes gene_type:complete
MLLQSRSQGRSIQIIGGDAMKQWSQQHFTGLTHNQHAVNNHWFFQMTNLLAEDGRLFVPTLNKTFNKNGEEV